jgi:hypothetical protein
VEVLRRAADAALRRGAPQSAGAYLRRALSEGGRTARLTLLHKLGHAEALAGDLRGIDHLREAISLADDAAVRVGITYELATLHALSGDWGSLPTEFGTPWPSQQKSTSISWRTSKPLAAPSSSSIRGPHTSSRSDFHAYSPLSNSAVRRFGGWRCTWRRSWRRAG